MVAPVTRIGHHLRRRRDADGRSSIAVPVTARTVVEVAP